MRRSDWNLLILAAAGGQPLSPVQLQKSIFLLQKAFPDAAEVPYDFQPYNYGAFDAAVYTDAEALSFKGLTRVTRTPGGWKDYAATEEGLEHARVLERQADPRAVEYARQVVAWARSLSFQDLVTAVYRAHPETKVNSIFKD